MTSPSALRSTVSSPTVEGGPAARMPASMSARVGRPSASMRRRAGTRGSRSVHSSRWTAASDTRDGRSSRRSVSSTKDGGTSVVVEQPEQVGAIAALDQRLGQLAQAGVVDEAHPPGDLLGAPDLEPLPVLDRTDVV